MPAAGGARNGSAPLIGATLAAMHRATPLLLTLVVLAACGGEPPPAQAWRGEANLVEVTLSGIHCPGCLNELEAALGAVEGVATVVVDMDSALVLIMLRKDTDREATIPKLRDAIHETGNEIVGEDVVG